jgi:hypothetical protein
MKDFVKKLFVAYYDQKTEQSHKFYDLGVAVISLQYFQDYNFYKYKEGKTLKYLLLDY